MSFSREHQINKLADNTDFELLVIGGGIVGAAALEMASNLGIKTLLVEKNDFSSGASSRSTKLLHGGIRYLPQMQFGLVRESLQEQKKLEELIGGLYKPLNLLAPIFKDDGFADLPKIFQNNFIAPKAFKAGLSFYDFLGLRNKEKRHISISKEEINKNFPLLKKENLSKGFLFNDAQTDDAKLVLTILRNAVEINKSLAVNYLEVINIKNNIDNFTVTLIDKIYNEKYLITTKKIIAATGVHTLPKEYKFKSSKMRFSGGAHIVLKGDPLGLNNKGVLLPKTEDKRIMFVLPWLNNTIVGTTDTEDFSGTLDNPFANKKDIEYLVRHVKKYFSINNVDYISSWSGVRALIGKDSTSSKNVSRGHYINNIDKNFIQVAGGKLTGFRSIAKESLESLFNKSFEMKKLEFIDDLIKIQDEYKSDELETCIRHYSVAKPLDYMLRRTHISWFNEEGGKASLNAISEHFSNKNSILEETLNELRAEGLTEINN